LWRREERGSRFGDYLGGLNSPRSPTLVPSLRTCSIFLGLSGPRNTHPILKTSNTLNLEQETKTTSPSFLHYFTCITMALAAWERELQPRCYALNDCLQHTCLLTGLNGRNDTPRTNDSMDEWADEMNGTYSILYLLDRSASGARRMKRESGDIYSMTPINCGHF
jgi:hypothetical protein